MLSFSAQGRAPPIRTSLVARLPMAAASPSLVPKVAAAVAAFAVAGALTVAVVLEVASLGGAVRSETVEAVGDPSREALPVVKVVQTRREPRRAFTTCAKSCASPKA